MDKIFTNSDYEEMLADGMSEETIETLKDATALAETIDMIPSDVSKLTDLMSALPDNYEDAINSIAVLAEKNPKLYSELMALASLALANNDSVVEKQVDPMLAALPEEERKQAEEKFFETLASLSPEKKEEFLKLLKTMSPDQKSDLIRELTK
ncbi:MAG: hypothetical protein J6A51_01930 [Clostridia bacterium]|nr:hypothetical protein [Clostridia bacterium]